MAAPVLNQKQQKRALSRKKPVLKTIVASPYTIHWPLISDEDSDFLKSLLERLLPRLKKANCNIPYKDIQWVPRMERREFRERRVKELAGPDYKDIDHDFNQYVAIGLNNVSDLIKNNEAASILISRDVEPILMVKHVTELAVLYRCPVLVMRHLRQILADRVGISSICIAFKKTFSRFHALYTLHKAICDISMKYPAPPDHIHFQHANENQNPDEPQQFQSNNEALGRELETLEISSDGLEEGEVVNDEPLYTYRGEDRAQKNFKTKVAKRRRFAQENFAFIPFCYVPESSYENPYSKYRGPIVKKIRGDTNRPQRVLQQIKISK